MRVPIVAVALCLAPALAASQSLGDAARQQAGKRATPPQAPKVYTEADLHPLDDTAAGEDPPPSNPAAKDATKGDESPLAISSEASPSPSETEDAVRAQLDRERQERQRREREWRGHARAARARIDAARREHDLVCGPGVLVLTGG